MKIKWGALVTDGRNKIGGHVASKNRAGAYLRTKVTPVNPDSTYQHNVRQRFGNLSSAWRGLDPDQRRAWNAAVADYARTDIFGDLRNPTGFNLHQKLNNNLLNVGIAYMEDPPMPAAVDAFNWCVVTVKNGVESVDLEFTPPIVAGHKVIVMMTPAISQGVSFVKSEYRQIFVMDEGDLTHMGLTAEYVAKFGAIGATGMVVFIKLKQVNTTTGQAGLSIAASSIITVGV